MSPALLVGLISCSVNYGKLSRCSKSANYDNTTKFHKWNKVLMLECNFFFFPSKQNANNSILRVLFWFHLSSKQSFSSLLAYLYNLYQNEDCSSVLMESSSSLLVSLQCPKMLICVLLIGLGLMNIDTGQCGRGLYWLRSYSWFFLWFSGPLHAPE